MAGSAPLLLDWQAGGIPEPNSWTVHSGFPANELDRIDRHPGQFFKASKPFRDVLLGIADCLAELLLLLVRRRVLGLDGHDGLGFEISLALP